MGNGADDSTIMHPLLYAVGKRVLKLLAVV